ncbi:MAG: RagB/SusD family nutrient uptake outer membrane protein [Bacteroidota bacterium]
MTKKWQEAATTAMEVMNLGAYDLFTEGDRTELFSPENQRDNEFIFVSVMSDTPDNVTGDGWLSHVVPRGYQWEYPPRAIFAAEFKIWSAFLELFDAEDERLNAFLFEFVNAEGETIILGEDNARSLKFPEYPNQDISRSADDFPFIRYADILLSRAEALNEISGPNQESVDLLNMIRQAAGVTTFAVGDFPGKEGLRDFILDERGREFHTEALRRQDLIRHGKFIQMAIERGKPANDYHVRYAIPQTEIDRNPNLTQNEGY